MNVRYVITAPAATASPTAYCTRVVRTSFWARSVSASVRSLLGCRVISHGPQSMSKVVATTPASAQSRYLNVNLRHISIGPPQPARFNGTALRGSSHPDGQPRRGWIGHSRDQPEHGSGRGHA